MSNSLTTEEQLQKMIAIINQFPNGMVEMDDNGTIVQMNAKGVQLLMPLFMQFQLSGTSMYEVFKVIDPEIVKRIIAFTDSFGTIMNLENFKISLSVANTNIDRYFYFTILKISETAISVVFDDITEVYEKENRIRDAIQEKAVEKSKFEMASGILHDIGNAVVGFGSYINRIKRHLAHSDYDNLKALQGFLEKNRHHFEPGIGNAKTNALLEMVAGIADNHQKNTQAANEIIAEQMSIIAHVSEILTIQRQYVKGQQTTEREKVNLRNIINDSISMILPNLAKSDISVQTDLPTDLTLVRGDKTKLIQVFLNILKNAAESIVAFDLSDKKIIINAKEKTDTIEIEVIDTGAGIDEATALNLFERGFTSKESGTGLGLYNCRSIVETHQGTFTLSSAGVGKGALALLTFKKIDMKYVQMNTRILVIDDEEIVRESIEEILSPKVKSNEAVDKAASILFDDEPNLIEHRSTTIPKFTVDKASSGKEGVEKIKQSLSEKVPYAVIFLDMRMPGWDGLETAVRIREVDNKVEIIFVTAYSDTSIDDIVAKAGQNVGYHCKPFASEEIIQLATKATNDYNKLRNLEQLIEAISSINVAENHLKPLLKNILDQLAGYSQTDTALLGKMHKDGTYEKIFSIGAIEEKVNTVLLQKTIDDIFLNSSETLVQSNEIIFAKLEDYVVFAALKKGTNLQTEKLYLLKLFVQNAAKAIRNAELQVKLLEKEKLSAAGKAISMLMHDLRSPIKNVPIITSMMRDDGVESEWLPLLDQAGEQASEIIDDFMDFIREAPVKKVPLNLLEITQDAIDLSVAVKSLSTLKMTVNIDPLLIIQGDKSKLKRVISNLVNNAAEILSDKNISEPAIDINAEQNEQEIIIQIKDNGPGIPEILLKTLFDPFVTHGKAGGTGLGLAIVKQFMVAHGGTIAVSNDGGALFTLKVPA